MKASSFETRGVGFSSQERFVCKIAKHATRTNVRRSAEAVHTLSPTP